VSTRVADRSFRVTLQRPGPGVPDGHGKVTQTWTNLVPPSLFARIVPATGKDLERLAAGTILSSLSRLVTLPYHPDITTICRLTWIDLVGKAHVASVTGVSPNARSTELELVVVEIVP
jgi:head-tail adaptor